MCDRLHRVLSICSHLLTLSDLSKSMWQTALRVLSIFSYLLTQSVTCSLTDQIVLRVSSVYSPLLTLSDLSRSFWQAALKVLSICSHLLTLICQGMCDRLHQVLSICSHLICQGACDRLQWEEFCQLCSHVLTLSDLSRSVWQIVLRVSSICSHLLTLSNLSRSVWQTALTVLLRWADIGQACPHGSQLHTQHYHYDEYNWAKTVHN